MMRKAFTYVIYIVIVVLAAIQLIRPDRTNPPVDPKMTFETIAKPTPEAVSVINRACRDCHSNATTWP